MYHFMKGRLGLSEQQRDMLERLEKLQEQASVGWLDYWRQYSHMGTWQFWSVVAMIVVPLAVLYVLLDRRKAFHLGFFGFNIHVWFTYADIVGARFGLWSYPYQAIPYLTVSFGLDAALVPAAFMLVYQWALNRRRSVVLSLTALCVFFSFVLKPFLVIVGLFQLHKWANYVYLFVFYVIIFSVSLGITKMFEKFQQQASNH